MNIRAGQIINDRYQVLSELGEGGFAQVYRALDLDLRREVAIKVLKFGLRENEQMARFKQEAKLLGKLEHKHIVSVFSYDLIEQERPFLVMELLEGRSLRSLLNQTSVLDCKTLTKILTQSCQALAYAHEAGVVHRDLSPENLFLANTDTEPQIKILDFGLSAMLTDNTGRLTKTGTLMGNPSYMSPEMAAGQRVDQRSDIYSLGCIIYECLTGKRPFQADTALALLALQKGEYPNSPEFSWNDSYQEELFKFIALRCMQKEADKRFQSCRQIIELLSGQASIAMTSLESLKPWTDKQSGAKKRKLRLAFISGTILAALLLTCAFVVSFSGKQKSMISSKEKTKLTTLSSPVQRLADIQKLIDSDPSASKLTNDQRSKLVSDIDLLIDTLQSRKGLQWAAYDLKANLLNIMLIVVNEPTRSASGNPQQILEDWKKTLKQELAICKLADGTYYKEACVVLKSFAAAYLSNKEFDTAIKYALSCLDFCKKVDSARKFPTLNPPIRKADTTFCRQESCNILANAYLGQGKPDEAERYAKAYLSILVQKDRFGPQESLLLASIYKQKQDKKKLFKLLDEILTDERSNLQNPESGDLSEALKIHLLTADWCIRYKETAKARQIAAKALETAVKANDKAMEQWARTLLESSSK